MGLLVTALELTLTVAFALQSFVSSNVQIAACAVFSIVNLYANIVYLPFYKPLVNMVNVMHGMLFASATGFMCVAILRGVPQVLQVVACPCKT